MGHASEGLLHSCPGWAFGFHLSGADRALGFFIGEFVGMFVGCKEDLDGGSGRCRGWNPQCL